MVPARRRRQNRNSGAARRPYRPTASRMQAVTRAWWQGRPITLRNARGTKRPHRCRGVRGTVVELEQGLRLALLVAACDEQTSGRPGLTPVAAPRVPALQREPEEIDGHLGYLRARRPEVADSSVHRVQAVSSRVTPSPPSRRQAAQSPAPTTPFTPVPDAQRALFLPGKGPDLRKLVAGAGFEPATSGL
jgi:hypothetical protein